MAGNGQYLDWAREVLHTEAEGLREIAAELDEQFVHAADALLHCKGRVDHYKAWASRDISGAK